MNIKWLMFLCFYPFLAFAQDDPVVMRVNSRDVHKSEFEYSYIHHQKTNDKALSLKEYVSVYALALMKVEAAKAAGLDTTLAFRQQHEIAYSRHVKYGLVDTLLIDSCIRDCGLIEMKPRLLVQVMQVFKSLPQTFSSFRLKEYQARMDSIYQVIQKQPEVDFSFWVNSFSEDKEIRWIAPLQSTVEFESEVFALSEKSISAPFMTPAGIHIVKVLRRKEESFDDKVVNERNKWLSRNRLPDVVLDKVLAKLRQEGHYLPNQNGIDELLSKGKTRKSLFTIGEKQYTGKDFEMFAAGHPLAVKRQFTLFVTKSLLDEAVHMRENSLGVRYALQQSDEAYLIQEIMQQKVHLPAENDQVGLAAYFDVNHSNYRWKEPRFKGAVLHCIDKRTAKRVKKLLRNLAPEKWKSCLQQTFASSVVEPVKMDQGTFAEGDNPYVDDKVFKKDNCSPMLSHPFTVVLGKKRKGPDDYREVIEQVKKDYQAFLYACWLKELKSSMKVEIVSDVLKTVNNN